MNPNAQPFVPNTPNPEENLTEEEQSLRFQAQLQERWRKKQLERNDKEDNPISCSLRSFIESQRPIKSEHEVGCGDNQTASSAAAAVSLPQKREQDSLRYAQPVVAATEIVTSENQAYGDLSVRPKEYIRSPNYYRGLPVQTVAPFSTSYAGPVTQVAKPTYPYAQHIYRPRPRVACSPQNMNRIANQLNQLRIQMPHPISETARCNFSRSPNVYSTQSMQQIHWRFRQCSSQPTPVPAPPIQYQRHIRSSYPEVTREVHYGNQKPSEVIPGPQQKQSTKEPIQNAEIGYSQPQSSVNVSDYSLKQNILYQTRMHSFLQSENFLQSYQASAIPDPKPETTNTPFPKLFEKQNVMEAQQQMKSVATVLESKSPCRDELIKQESILTVPSPLPNQVNISPVSVCSEEVSRAFETYIKTYNDDPEVECFPLLYIPPETRDIVHSYKNVHVSK